YRCTFASPRGNLPHGPTSITSPLTAHACKADAAACQENEQPVGTTQRLNHLIAFRNSRLEPSRGSLVTLSRTGLVMEVYPQVSVIQLSVVLHDLEIRAANEVIYRGRAIVTALVNTGLMLIVSVRLMDDWAGAANMVGSPRQLCEDVETFVAEWTQGPGIRPDYQLAVARIQAFLSELSSRMERSRIQQPDTEGAVGDPPEGEADEALMERLCASVLP